jgi:hypothetical protein
MILLFRIIKYFREWVKVNNKYNNNKIMNRVENNKKEMKIFLVQIKICLLLLNNKINRFPWIKKRKELPIDYKTMNKILYFIFLNKIKILD